MLKLPAAILPCIFFATNAISQTENMSDSVKNLLAAQFVKIYLPQEQIAIDALAFDVTTWDIDGNYHYRGCGDPIIFSQPLNSMLAHYNLPDSLLISQANNYVRLWDKRKVPFKLVQCYKSQLFPWRSIGYIPGLFYPKFIYSISNPVFIDPNTIAIKYFITKRNGKFVKGPVLAILKKENGNLTLITELK